MFYVFLILVIVLQAVLIMFKKLYNDKKLKISENEMLKEINNCDIYEYNYLIHPDNVYILNKIALRNLFNESYILPSISQQNPNGTYVVNPLMKPGIKNLKEIEIQILNLLNEGDKGAISLIFHMWLLYHNKEDVLKNNKTSQLTYYKTLVKEYKDKHKFLKFKNPLGILIKISTGLIILLTIISLCYLMSVGVLEIVIALVSGIVLIIVSIGCMDTYSSNYYDYINLYKKVNDSIPDIESEYQDAIERNKVPMFDMIVDVAPSNR